MASKAQLDLGLAGQVGLRLTEESGPFLGQREVGVQGGAPVR